MSEKKPLISVIVPVYGVEEYLDKCVESIVNQTYENLEIFLVDDGSPDNCPQMCDEWAKKDNRIKVIHKQNGGLSSARNAGLDNCTGEYVGFIDSDDFIRKDTYEIMYEDMKKKNVDIVRCGMDRYISNKIVHNDIKYANYYSHDNLLDYFFYYKNNVCGGVCDKLFRIELFENVRFPEGLNSEDYLALIKIYTKSKGMYNDNTPLYYYRLREGSITREEKVNEHSLDKIIISDEIYKFVKLNMMERLEDAKTFQAITRFDTYYKSVNKIHTKEMRKAWKIDLKEHYKHIKNNSNISKTFKMKYQILMNAPKLYTNFKEIIGRGL